MTSSDGSIKDQVLLTGAAGRVGAVLAGHLGRPTRAFDRADGDLLDAGVARRAVVGCHQVVHLAWNLQTENYDNGGRDPANLSLLDNVLAGAAEAGARRVVVASSVHAGGIGRTVHRGAGPAQAGPPTTLYGAGKLTSEVIGRQAATDLGLDVVALRLGGVQARRAAQPQERGIWTGLHDLRAAVRAVLDAPVQPGRFEAFYVLSWTPWRRHSTANSFGWRPSLVRAAAGQRP
ncbi:MAG: NAD-dependent epimerase [Humibacillus sp.]|nr:NAD-dependent epimerase [Humibacillus sp.]